ncbi:aryl-sulfate sulfotransferase [Robertkochia aurantiaca]|uniref:aryl-sulfate sulfotransferase n=1 Tax=Robertkochia aurantiaca TaxID=2873700 RepID=UPI001CCD97CA|nr:aryl-sulfate sulfotransferase [Robertkochia sp. 3YJGBD-33]
MTVRNLSRLFFLSIFLLCISCDNSETIIEELPPEGGQPEPPVEEPVGETNDRILVNNLAQKQDGYVLINDPGNDRVYLMEKEDGSVFYEWTLADPLGNDVELFEDGTLLACLGVTDPDFTFGGFGGKIAVLNPDGSEKWSLKHASPEHIAHHDAEMLPNGNILFMVWERMEGAVAVENGYNRGQENIYLESLIEIDPATDAVVWKWNSADHLVQDVDDNRQNFGVVAENPGKIDVNYFDDIVTDNLDNGDFMHANGLTYDAQRDLIFLSVNYFSEVWVIDHSTTTAEAAGSEGGNYGVGGDLVYRFGNPSAYDNAQGERRFFNVHTPVFVEGTDNMLVYVNGNVEGSRQSKVLELSLPATLGLVPGTDNEPAVVWEYSHPDMYSPKVSSAYRLPDGNTLITIGTFGVWEVNPEKEIVWQFKDEGFFWRAYHVERDSPAIDLLGI